MKSIKPFLFCAVLAASFTASTTPAHAQSISLLCQIHEGNLSRYTARYDLFNKSANIPRPFILNNRPYQLAKNTTLAPLFYVALPKGSLVAFQVKGAIDNKVVGKRDIVTLFTVQDDIGLYTENIGFCENGVFQPFSEKQLYRISQLPRNTQLVLHEAQYSASTERINNMFN